MALAHILYTIFVQSNDVYLQATGGKTYDKYRDTSHVCDFARYS